MNWSNPFDVPARFCNHSCPVTRKSVFEYSMPEDAISLHFMRVFLGVAVLSSCRMAGPGVGRKLRSAPTGCGSRALRKCVLKR